MKGKAEYRYNNHSKQYQFSNYNTLLLQIFFILPRQHIHNGCP